MKPKLTTKKGNKLSNSERTFMNKSRIKEYGENDKDFKNNEKQSIFFFVKDKKKIVAFGMLKPIKMNYLSKTYNILGIGNIMSIKKGRGYGKVLIQSMVDYLKKKEKTGLGFTGNKNVPFYKKAGLSAKKKFSFRFVLKNPKTGKKKFDDENCPGVYYNGKDDFISKVLKTKSVATYYIKGLENPHW